MWHFGITKRWLLFIIYTELATLLTNSKFMALSGMGYYITYPISIDGYAGAICNIDNNNTVSAACEYPKWVQNWYCSIALNITRPSAASTLRQLIVELIFHTYTTWCVVDVVRSIKNVSWAGRRGDTNYILQLLIDVMYIRAYSSSPDIESFLMMKEVCLAQGRKYF